MVSCPHLIISAHFKLWEYDRTTITLDALTLLSNFSHSASIDNLFITINKLLCMYIAFLCIRYITRTLLQIAIISLQNSSFPLMQAYFFIPSPKHPLEFQNVCQHVAPVSRHLPSGVGVVVSLNCLVWMLGLDPYPLWTPCPSTCSTGAKKKASKIQAYHFYFLLWLAA